MAEINADAETVINLLTEKIARLEQENAILGARILTAGKLLDEAANHTHDEPTEAPTPKGKR